MEASNEITSRKLYGERAMTINNKKKRKTTFPEKYFPFVLQAIL